MPVGLAYGGFSFTDRDFALGVERLLVWALLALLAYGPASGMAQLRGWKKVLALPVFVLIAAILAPHLGVMGEYGPAHVAGEVGRWVFPAFFVVLVVKIVSRFVAERGRRAPA